MENTLEQTELVVTIQSDCTCEVFNEEEIPTQSDDCFGCYGDDLMYLRDEVIAKWVEVNGDDASNAVRVEGQSMGWQYLYGYKVVILDDVAESLNLRGDFRIVFTLKGTELTARRWSHDEPTGHAVFTFEFVGDDAEITH
jgi:hypothetical protein